MAPGRQRVYAPNWREYPDILTWTRADEISISDRQPPEGADVCIPATELGHGASGSVFKVLRTRDGALLAGKRSLWNVAGEARHLRENVHRHITRYEGLYRPSERPEEMLLLTELCGGGSLDGVIRSQQPLSVREILVGLRQLSDALAWMHARGVCHSDVKPANVLIRSRSPLDIALCDLELVSRVGVTRQGPVGTVAMWSPQMWRDGETVTARAADDVWAMGVTLLAMCGQLPVVKVVDYQNWMEMADYPDQCVRRAQALLKANPEDPLMELAVKMLHWGADRVCAAYVFAQTGTILHELQWQPHYRVATL